MQVTINGLDYAPVPAPLGTDITLGKALWQLRKKTGMSIELAAHLAGCSKSHLWTLEHDQSMPVLDLASRLARQYGVSVDLLGAYTLPHNPLN